MTMGTPVRGLARRQTGGNGHRNDHVNLERHQLARKSRKAIQYASGVTPVYLNGLAVDVAQAIQKRRIVFYNTGVLFRTGPEHSDQPHPILLSARRERKTGRAAEKHDELAPSHWTSNGKRLIR